LRAFREADFSFCVEALSEAFGPAATALRARALLRAGRYEKALSSVVSCDVRDLADEEAGELLAIKASALCALRDAEAEATFIEARARAFSSGSAATECEVEYATAVYAWTQGRLGEALEAIDRVMAVSENALAWLPIRPDASCSPAYWRARAYDLRGLSEAAREDYQAQARSLARAFEEFDRGNVIDLQVEAAMLYNLAVLVRDIDSPDLCVFVYDRAERVAWNAHTAFFEYEVFKALGWCRARMGDHLGAFRFFRRAADCAPSPALRISAVIDRSFLARELGEVVTAGEDLEYAIRVTRRIDWEAVSGSERSVLFALASQVAPNDAKQARRLMARYAALKSPVSPFEVFANGNRRQRADECSAQAAVLCAEGERDRAISLLLESFQIWTEVGYTWRAAGIAADLAQLTGETRFFEVAAREAAKQPNSWLARRVAGLLAASPTIS
jgi:tetratricopeptide (TPR) repeat protein